MPCGGPYFVTKRPASHLRPPSSGHHLQYLLLPCVLGQRPRCMLPLPSLFPARRSRAVQVVPRAAVACISIPVTNEGQACVLQTAFLFCAALTGRAVFVSVVASFACTHARGGSRRRAASPGGVSSQPCTLAAATAYSCLCGPSPRFISQPAPTCPWAWSVQDLQVVGREAFYRL